MKRKKKKSKYWIFCSSALRILQVFRSRSEALKAYKGRGSSKTCDVLLKVEAVKR